MIIPNLQKLIQIPICRGLTESEGATVLDISEEVTVQQGTVLFREGDAGDSLFVILDGALEVTKQDPSGEPQHLARVGEGGVVGEMSILGGNHIRSATVTAATDARLLALPATRFARLLKSENVAALKIVYNLAQVMSQRLQQVNQKVVELLGQGKKKQELEAFQKILSHWSF